MRNPTKCCELNIVLTTGDRMHGTYHVPVGMDNKIRPADAIRTLGHEYLLLCDVTVENQAGSRTLQAVLIRGDAIAFVELPPAGWSIREIHDESPRAAAAAALYQSN
ncbi:MAG: hypothetical protein HOP29_17810 [Phycisphaerales bacterium]|nr:hypothetical protein [Phycisphaerales bacterium]